MSSSKRHYIDYPGGKSGLGFSIAAGIKKGNFVFVSGSGAVGQDGRVPIELRGDTAGQTRWTLNEIDRILKEAGGSILDGIMFTVFLSHAGHFHQMNDVWTEYFKGQPPTRTTVEADLMDPDLLVEISAIAMVDDE